MAGVDSLTEADDRESAARRSRSGGGGGGGGGGGESFLRVHWVAVPKALRARRVNRRRRRACVRDRRRRGSSWRSAAASARTMSITRGHCRPGASRPCGGPRRSWPLSVFRRRRPPGLATTCPPVLRARHRPRPLVRACLLSAIAPAAPGLDSDTGHGHGARSRLHQWRRLISSTASGARSRHCCVRQCG
jgi:hypothetical protein